MGLPNRVTESAIRLLVALFVFVEVGGCTEIVRQPVGKPLTISPNVGKAIQIVGNQEIRIEGGLNSRVLKDGEEWLLVGRIPQGDVYKYSQGVFTIEGVNVFEAYLVIQQRSLMGFYVPFDNSFVANRKSTALNFREGQ